MSYKRKIAEDLDCGLVIAMKAFGSKWKPCILDAINKGFHRPSEIHKQVPEASPRVIDMQLRELENDGMVEKNKRGLSIAYKILLTEAGRSILPLLDAMDKWGLANKNIYTKEPELTD